MEEAHEKMPKSCHWRNANSNHKERYLLGCLKLEEKKKHLTIPNANKNMKQLDPHTLLVGRQNSTVISENRFAVSYKVTHTLTK